MEQQYKCVLIDDELLALSYLRTLVESIPEVEVVKAFNEPIKLLEELPNLQFDFVISDIVMPVISGIELAQSLRKTPVIFTTAHNEFAADAFDVDATDYLRKPIQRDRLEKAIEKVKREILNRRHQHTVIHFQTAKGKMQVVTHEIASFSAETIDRRDKLLTLTNGETMVIKNCSFSYLLELLPKAGFCRISRGTILSMAVVSGYSGDKVLIRSGSLVAEHVLGDPFRKAFLQQWQQRFSP